ncbi:MAG: hypothetical protein QG640_736 [Patescibacteria group bacterium]|nr:hypothetical protein [Patescibacteria group bacterium]
MQKSTLLAILGEQPEAALKSNFHGLERQLADQFTDIMAVVMFGEKPPVTGPGNDLSLKRLHEVVDEVVYESHTRLGRLAAAYAFVHEIKRGESKTEMEGHILRLIESLSDSSQHVPDTLIAILLRLDIFGMNIEKAARAKIAATLAFVPAPNPQLQLAVGGAVD